LNLSPVRRTLPDLHFEPFTCKKNVTGYVRSVRVGNAYTVLVSSTRESILWEVTAWNVQRVNTWWIGGT